MGLIILAHCTRSSERVSVESQVCLWPVAMVTVRVMPNFAHVDLFRADYSVPAVALLL